MESSALIKDIEKLVQKLHFFYVEESKSIKKEMLHPSSKDESGKHKQNYFYNYKQSQLKAQIVLGMLGLIQKLRRIKYDQ